MSRKRFTAESIIIKLREAEVGLAQGQTVGQVCRQIGVLSNQDKLMVARGVKEETTLSFVGS